MSARELWERGVLGMLMAHSNRVSQEAPANSQTRKNA